MNEPCMKRQHPYAIVRYTSKNFWLLLIPLLRGLFALRFDFYRWAEGAGWDILVVTVMLGIAVCRWYFTEYEFTSEGIYIDSGLAARVRKRIPLESISAVTSEADPVMEKLKAVKLYIDTDAASGGRRDPDLKMIVSASERAKLFNILSAFIRNECEAEKGSSGKNGFNYIYKVSKVSLVVFSVLFSSALSGVILLVTLFSQSGKIIGEKLEQDIITAVNGVTDTVSLLVGKLVSSIPPAGILISLVIAAGFVLSFVTNLLRHINFTVERRGRYILISSGLFVKRKYFINTGRINYADMRQNLLMKIFGITSVHISCTGYGKQKNEIPVFVPICGINKLNDGHRITGLKNVMEMLLPQFHFSDGFISPGIWYIWRFIGPPAVLVFAVMICGFVASVFFQEWYYLIMFLTVLLEIPSVWLLFVKLGAYCTNGLNIVRRNVCIKYCKGYGYHTVTVPLDRVAEIAITQTVFQRMNRSCDVIVYTNSEYTGYHRVRGLPLGEVRELLEERF